MIIGKTGSGDCRAVGMGLAVLFVVPLLGLMPARAEESAEGQFAKEMVKQQGIYRSQGKNVPDGYITNRTLENYAELLPTGFSDALRRLGPNDRWLDIGAGGGQAILDYSAPEYDFMPDGKVKTGGKAKAVAISIEDRRSARWWKQSAIAGGDRLQYLHGKRLREYTNEELGKFQIITDVFGGFSYTPDLSLFIEKVLSLLDVGGSFFTMVQSVHLENGKDDPATWYLTELIDPAGRDVKICTWLKSVSCVRVSCESKSSWDAPTELIRVTKTCEDVAVPPLKRLRFEAGNPPERHFQLPEPLPQARAAK
jgi:SAM-dependent methyltransferase